MQDFGEVFPVIEVWNHEGQIDFLTASLDT